jgi:protein-tyrosine-phosphatase
MSEIGIDISLHRSKRLHVVSGEAYDYVVILAEPAAEAIQAIEAKIRLPWFHPDPACEPGSEEEVKAKIRRVRDALKTQIETFAKNL